VNLLLAGKFMTHNQIKYRQRAYGVQNETVFRFAASYSYAPLLWILGQVEQKIPFEGLGLAMTKVDPLMQALHGCESRLMEWLNECDLNAELFRRDPLTAIRAANLGIDEGLLAELEEALTGIALKLGLASEVRSSGT
jgi:hypothetical protein